jgi:hypothetical protein
MVFRSHQVDANEASFDRNRFDGNNYVLNEVLFAFNYLTDFRLLDLIALARHARTAAPTRGQVIFANPPNAYRQFLSITECRFSAEVRTCPQFLFGRVPEILIAPLGLAGFFPKLASAGGNFSFHRFSHLHVSMSAVKTTDTPLVPLGKAFKGALPQRHHINMCHGFVR